MNIRRALVDSKILKEDHWKLSSGRHSKLYVSKDRIPCAELEGVLNPKTYVRTINELSFLIRASIEENAYDIITGPAVAGISFAAPVAYNLEKSFVYPEKFILDKETGDYEMRFRKDFQDVIGGRKLILIEDVITTGGSVMKTIKAIHGAGGRVIGVLCIWNRNPRLVLFDTEHARVIPVYSLIEEEVESWETEDECPLCRQNTPLLDPKTNKVIKQKKYQHRGF